MKNRGSNHYMESAESGQDSLSMTSNHKKALPAMFAAAVKRRMRILCVTMVIVLAFTGIITLTSASASNRQSIQDTLDRVAGAVDAAEPLYQELIDMIAEEVEAMKEGYEDDGEYDTEEAEAEYEELNGYISQLSSLISGLSGLPSDLNSSEGKTVYAAKEYLTMLLNMTTDLAELLRYSIDMYYAIEPFGLMDMDTDDFTVIADQIWSRCNESKILLEQIVPPAYIAITHNEMTTRVTEFRDFGEDFYYACYLEDPLRMYSCIYRMNRIIRMFEICDDNLTADLELQFRQAEHRVTGPISQLRDELNANLELMNNAFGGER